MPQQGTQWRVEINPKMLFLALERIVSNGYKALQGNPKASPIKFSIQRSNKKGYVRLRVVNEGELPKGAVLFEPNLALPTEVPSDAGVGLSYTARALRLMGASISARNIIEGGVRKVEFIIELPKVNAAMTSEDDPIDEFSRESELFDEWYSMHKDAIEMRQEEVARQTSMAPLEAFLSLYNNKNSRQTAEYIQEAIRAGKQIIIEIGAGNTANALALAQKNPDAVVLAIDPYLGNATDGRYAQFKNDYESGSLPAQNSNLNIKVIRASADIMLYLPNASVSKLIYVQSNRRAFRDLIILTNSFNLMSKLRSDGQIAIFDFYSLTNGLKLMADKLHFTKQTSTEFMGVDLRANSLWAQELMAEGEEGALFIGEPNEKSDRHQLSASPSQNPVIGTKKYKNAAMITKQKLLKRIYSNVIGYRNIRGEEMLVSALAVYLMRNIMKEPDRNKAKDRIISLVGGSPENLGVTMTFAIAFLAGDSEKLFKAIKLEKDKTEYSAREINYFQRIYNTLSNLQEQQSVHQVMEKYLDRKEHKEYAEILKGLKEYRLTSLDDNYDLLKDILADLTLKSGEVGNPAQLSESQSASKNRAMLIKDAYPDLGKDYGVNNSDIWLVGNEAEREAMFKKLAEIPKKPNGVHIGFGSFINPDIIAKRRPAFAILGDVNSHMEVYWKVVREAILDPQLDSWKGIERRRAFLRGMITNFYDHIMTEEDRDHIRHLGEVEEFSKFLEDGVSWLSSDDDFEFIRRMFAENRIQFIPLDIRDTAKFGLIKQWLDKNGLQTDTMYVSNIYAAVYGLRAGDQDRYGGLKVADFKDAYWSSIATVSNQNTLLIDADGGSSRPLAVTPMADLPKFPSIPEVGPIFQRIWLGKGRTKKPAVNESSMLAKSKAMTSGTGGIDLTADKMNVEIASSSRLGGTSRNDTEGFNINPALPGRQAGMLTKLQNAPGFVPVITNIEPMTDLRQFLEVGAK